MRHHTISPEEKNRFGRIAATPRLPSNSLECKVSNTARSTRSNVPEAVLQDCFKTSNLIDAQKSGVFLFWSSDPTPLIEFVNATKNP